MNKSLIGCMQEIVFVLSQQILARAVQCEIFKFKGFLKLHEKYTKHLAEEREYMQKSIEHIILMGGKIDLTQQNNSSNKIDNDYGKTFENPVDYLKHECEISKNGLAFLKDIIKKAEEAEEYLLYNFLVEYYKDEQDDLNWTLQQLNLIKIIGEENWIINQL